MAERQQQQPQQQNPTPDQRGQAAAESAAEAERVQADETVEGGRYKVGDQMVDANGEPLKERKSDQ